MYVCCTLPTLYGYHMFHVDENVTSSRTLNRKRKSPGFFHKGGVHLSPCDAPAENTLVPRVILHLGGDKQLEAVDCPPDQVQVHPHALGMGRVPYVNPSLDVVVPEQTPQVHRSDRSGHAIQHGEGVTANLPSGDRQPSPLSTRC